MSQQEPLFEMPQESTQTENHSIKNEIEDFWPELTTDCLCIMGLAGIHHVQTEDCLNVEDAVPVAQEPTMEEVDSIVKESRGRGRPPKEDHELVDPVSAGRKRAAAKVKIKTGTKCEWAFLKYAGGGVKPIMGCTGYPASALHHGPDKSTLNNSRPEDVGAGEAYNLHAICVWCHNRYHTANDKYYGDNGGSDRPVDNSTWVPVIPYKEHDPNTFEDKTTVFFEEMKRLKLEKEAGLDYSKDLVEE